MTRSEEAYVGQGELHSALLLRPSHLQLEVLRPAAVVLVKGVPSVRTEKPAGHPLAETSQCAAQCSALQSVCVLQGSVVKVREHSAVQCTGLYCSTAQCLTNFLSTSLQNLRLSSSPVRVLPRPLNTLTRRRDLLKPVVSSKTFLLPPLVFLTILARGGRMSEVERGEVGEEEEEGGKALVSLRPFEVLVFFLVIGTAIVQVQ